MDIEKINVGGTEYDVCDSTAREAVGKIKIRASVFLTTEAYQNAGTVTSVDTGVDFESGDMCIVYSANGSMTSNIVYVPCVRNNHWYISCNAPNPGGGPDGFQVMILNVKL